MHYNPVRRMRYVIQHRLIHLGPMLGSKLGCGGAFCRRVSTFLLKVSYSYGGSEGRVKLDNASWMAFTG